MAKRKDRWKRKTPDPDLVEATRKRSEEFFLELARKGREQHREAVEKAEQESKRRDAGG